MQSLSDKLEDFCEKANMELPEDQQIKQVPQVRLLAIRIQRV